MKIDKYELKSGEQLEVFEFGSIGQKGRIPKIVQYTPTNYKDLYNLGFGDKNIETGEIEDNVISNNGDSEKVLATVVATLYAFIDKQYLEEIKEDFEIYGELENGWEEFQKDIEYEAFLLKLKNK
jgi:hypothetical protein